MKRLNLCSLAAVAMVMVGCQGRYVVETNVDHKGRVQRTVYSSDSTFFLASEQGWNRTRLAEPFEVNFYDASDSMRYRLEAAADSLPLLQSEVNALCPEESLRRRFRWFVTRYDYRAHFAQAEPLPVAMDDYLTDEQARLFLQGGVVLEKYNGYEAYRMLDSLNTAFSKWICACMFEVQYEALCGYANDEQRAVLERYRTDLLAAAIEQADPLELNVPKMAAMYGELDFVAGLASQHEAELDETVSSEVDRWLELGQGALYRTVLPGKGECEVKVDGYRLLVGDVDVEVSSVLVNWWAWVVTALALALVVFGVVRRRR